jgi:hypothetical protein
VKKFLSLLLAGALSLIGAAPSKATTYTPVLDLSMQSDLAFGLYQDGTLVDEAYEYSIDYNFVFGSIEAEKPLLIEITSGTKSMLTVGNRPSTNECSLKVGIGYASGRVLEQDPKRVLGSIPLTVIWTPNVLFPTLSHWQVSASGAVPGPDVADIGVHNNLIFHVVCDGQVLDAFPWTFASGVVGRPVMSTPQLEIKGTTAAVTIGDVKTVSVTDLVQVIFEYCESLRSTCIEFGDTYTYYSYQVGSPISFNLTGLNDVYIRVWVGAANKYGTSSAFSSKIALGNPESRSQPQVGDTDLLVQLAGSQVFVTSETLQGTFEIYEDGEFVDRFVFDGVIQAYIVEQRLTGAIQIRQVVNGSASRVNYELTKTLLWFQNVNLGSFSETSLGSSARDKVSNLVNHRFLDSGTWKQRDSEVTKFICTGIYREGGSAAEKLSARKKAKLACESAKVLDSDPNSKVSFIYQTKTTKAASYVGKVLVTVKGIEPFVASRIN